MPFANRLAKPRRQFLAGLLVFAAVACGQSTASTNTPITATTTPGISSDDIRLPAAWLFIGDQQVAGTLAAGGTPQGHFDPALALPDLKTAILPPAAPVIIAIESDLIQNITATVRPWIPDGTIIPLVDPSARRLQIESERTGNPTLV